MARIPFKISRLKVRHTRPRYIIIHHTKCQYDLPESKIDNSEYQMKSLTKGVLEDKSADINFHYVIEKIKDDYQAIACRPIVTMCDYDDVDKNINNYAIHIALMGSYDFKVPSKRMYEVLCYRVINPILKIWKLNPTRIKLHSEVSENKDIICPGDFIDKNIIIATTRRFLLK